MSPHIFAHRFLLIVILSVAFDVSAAPTAPPEGPEDEAALPDMEPRWRVVARWFGTFNRDVERYAANEPGHWAMSPHHHQVSSGNVVLREEVDDVLGLRRTIVESFSWSSNVSNMYYFNHRTRQRLPAGPGGSGGGSHGEAELSSPGRVTPEIVADSRRELQEAKDKYQRAAREKKEAERAVAAAEANANNKGKNNAANVPPPELPAPTTQVAADALEAQKKMAAVFADPSSSQQARDAALKRMQETSQAYADWMTRRVEEFNEKYTAEIEKLQKVVDDPNSTEAQRDEAGNRLVAVSDAMAKDQQDLFGTVPETPKDPRERLEEATAELDAVRRDLLLAAGRSWQYENFRAQRLEANAEVIEKGGGGLSVRANIGIPSTEDELATFTVPGAGDEEPHRFGVDPEMGGEADADEHGAATITQTDKGGGGEDGLIGGAMYTKSFYLTRVPVKNQLRFKGKIYHRIRVPTTGPSEPSLILQNGNPVSLAGAIPLMGNVRVEGRLYEPGEAPPPRSPTPTRDFVGPPPPSVPPPGPPVNHTDSIDGEFDLVMPLKPGKIIRLTFVYHNSEAEVTEWAHVDVPVDVATHAWGKIEGTQGQAPTPPLDRHAECSLRWETKPRLFALGSERRGATVERENDWHIVSFQGYNAILVNTFILKTPYLNQNRHPFEVKARVPAAKLLAARPQWIPEGKVRARLGVAASGAAADETTIGVPIRGPFLCFPTSVGVSLAGLGLIDISEGAAQSDEVGKLAQAIYEHYHDTYKKMPAMFPFPADPTLVNQIAESNAIPPSFYAFSSYANYLANEYALLAAYAHWPFVDAKQKTMEWLVSLKHPDKKVKLTLYGPAGATHVLALDLEHYRPWQWAWITDSYVKKRFGIEAYTYEKSPDPFNVFAADPAKILHVIGSGCASVVSISHRSSTGEKGGHLIALVGVVTDSSGDIVRWIFHDPYGDQTRNPFVPGYYDPGKNRQFYDQDPPAMEGEPRTWGRYAPYGPEINSWQGTMKGKFWEIFEPKPAMTAESMKKRMLPSVATSSSYPPPS